MVDNERQENELLTIWRLGRLEKTIEDLHIKLDLLSDIKQDIITHTVRLASLEKSRDRLIAGISVLATSTILLAVQTLFGVANVS